MTDIFEGSIIRLARRLDEFLNQVNLTDLLALILYLLDIFELVERCNMINIGELDMEGKHFPVILLSPLTYRDLFYFLFVDLMIMWYQVGFTNSGSEC